MDVCVPFKKNDGINKSRTHTHIQIQLPFVALETSELFGEWFGLSVLTE